jgi:hypothetical protein
MGYSSLVRIHSWLTSYTNRLLGKFLANTVLDDAAFNTIDLL